MQPSPYDPTQRVPPPIEPTRYDDLTPPPPPLIPAELPYFQVKRRVHWTTVLAFGVLLFAALLILLGLLGAAGVRL